MKMSRSCTAWVFDRRRELKSIACEVGISFGSVQSILTDILRMSKKWQDGSCKFVLIIRKKLGLIFLGILCLTTKMIPAILSSEFQPKMRRGFTTSTQSKKCRAANEAPRSFSREGAGFNLLGASRSDHD